MAGKNIKQFGIWMDTHQATVVGREEVDYGDFKVIGRIENPGASSNSNENAAHNQKIALAHKFFKEICSKMPNADELLVTGTGKIQEQFINYLAETPQYKNTRANESTSNKMSDEQLIEMVAGHFKHRLS